MSSTELPPVPRLPTRETAAPRRRGPRERALSAQAIADAALRVIDAEGLDAMTMRRVAQELGTGAASLYAHVAGKEEVLELVIDRVIGEVPLPADDDASWQEQVKAGLRAIRSAFASHRDVARASFARIPLGENALRGAEWMARTLRRANLPDQVVAYAVDVLALYATAIAYEESLYAAEGISPEQMAGYVEEMRRYFASLPADRFPNVVSLAGPMAAGDSEERFEFGLELLVRGLAAMSDWAG